MPFCPPARHAARRQPACTTRNAARASPCCSVRRPRRPRQLLGAAAGGIRRHASRDHVRPSRHRSVHAFADPLFDRADGRGRAGVARPPRDRKDALQRAFHRWRHRPVPSQRTRRPASEKLVLSATWPKADAYFRRLFEVRKGVLESQGVRAYAQLGNLVLFPPYYYAANAAVIDDKAEKIARWPRARSGAHLAHRRYPGLRRCGRPALHRA